MNVSCLKDSDYLNFDLDLDGGLYYAFKYGHLDIVELMIKRSANNWSLQEACYDGVLKSSNVRSNKVHTTTKTI